jgi:hypothetical protein
MMESWTFAPSALVPYIPPGIGAFINSKDFYPHRFFPALYRFGIVLSLQKCWFINTVLP